jgi:hypothetical protein
MAAWGKEPEYITLLKRPTRVEHRVQSVVELEDFLNFYVESDWIKEASVGNDGP